jgi:hypothetical protein
MREKEAGDKSSVTFSASIGVIAGFGGGTGFGTLGFMKDIKILLVETSTLAPTHFIGDERARLALDNERSWRFLLFVQGRSG